VLHCTGPLTSFTDAVCYSKPIEEPLVSSNSQKLLLAVDLMGTFVFAVEGALTAVAGDLDFLGLVVLSFVTALGGGLIGDLLIKDIPPGSIRDWRYGTVAFAGGAATFFLYERVLRVPPPLIIVLDAAGLSLFAVGGSGEGAGLRHPSLDRGPDGLYHRGRGWNRSRCFVGAGSYCAAR
jgi:Glycine transporter